MNNFVVALYRNRVIIFNGIKKCIIFPLAVIKKNVTAIGDKIKTSYRNYQTEKKRYEFKSEKILAKKIKKTQKELNNYDYPRLHNVYNTTLEQLTADFLPRMARRKQFIINSIKESKNALSKLSRVEQTDFIRQQAETVLTSKARLNQSLNQLRDLYNHLDIFLENLPVVIQVAMIQNDDASRQTLADNVQAIQHEIEQIWPQDAPPTLEERPYNLQIQLLNTAGPTPT